MAFNAILTMTIMSSRQLYRLQISQFSEKTQKISIHYPVQKGSKPTEIVQRLILKCIKLYRTKDERKSEKYLA